MGLLDEAIREHLELKRRRGADPAEIARQEQEALGPVRREPEPAVEPMEHGEPAVEAGGDEPRYDDEPHYDAEPSDVGAVAASGHPDAAGVPFDAEASDAPPASAGQPTEEWGFDDEEEAEPEPEQPEEDPLEDTPEFLSETPEHDRLWFEQKPPKDFDFD